VRSPGNIRRELDALAARRTALWDDLGARYDPEKTAEVARLGARMERLWLELRETRMRLRFGTPEAIRARARVDALVERELNARGAGRPRARREAQRVS
jgi:hypothetical protein